jgi:toxin ParE1/3/4
MPFAVFLTNDAARDIDDLCDHIAVHHSPQEADDVLEQIEKAFSRLSEFPEPGAYPRELLAPGIREPGQRVHSPRLAAGGALATLVHHSN